MPSTRREWLISALSGSVALNYIFSCKTSQAGVSLDENNTATELANSNTGGLKIHSLEGNIGHGVTAKNGRVQGKFMQIEQVADLTITDTAWENYQMPGHYKRWKLDDIEWQSSPLVNYKFSEAYRNKPVSIEVAVFSMKDYIYPVKIFQQLIFLT